MTTLTLNSHSLSDYQRCPELYNLRHRQSLQTVKKYLPFHRGSIIAEMLAEYYKAIRDSALNKEKVFEILKTFLEPSELEEKDLIETRFLQYFGHYKNDGQWQKIVAVEEGFTYELYNDGEYQFLYEGRPDMVAIFNNELAIIDHKHESVRHEIYPYNNQALGYCAATGARQMFYNHFGIQETGTKEKWFHRHYTKFSEEDIDNWKRSTIQWYFRILEDTALAQTQEQYPGAKLQSTAFLKTLRCEERYGLCVFTKVCEMTNEWARADFLKKNFKIEEYKSW